jgi:hypothetical protein
MYLCHCEKKMCSTSLKNNLLWTITFLLCPCLLFAQKDTLTQKRDSTNLIQNLKNSRLGKELSRTITVRQFSDTVKQERSEDKLKPFQGKIVRRIIIEHIGFDKSIYNPEKKIRNTATRVANHLHTDTRPQIIKQHLFFYEGRPLNPYKLADNERYLRDLDFILDSRIVAEPIDNSEDSVDVRVITRDVFSLGGRVTPDLSSFKVGLYDVNLMGQAQRIDATMLYDIDRNPQAGFNVFYRKSSLLGSLTNVTFGYTQLNNGVSYGEENEYAYYVRLDRPLVSPYSRWAGGVEISRNWSTNVFSSPDSLFKNYGYNAQNFWAGYNIGTRNNMNDRKRHFVAARYFEQHFLQRPQQLYEMENPLYNNRQLALASITFYEQNFYKTRYVYGFGRTEDVPYGEVITITSGWSKELSLKRPYIAADFVKSFVEKKGNFYSVRGAAGGYMKQGELQDVTFLASANFYSRLIDYKKLKLRQSLEGGYTEIFHQRTNNLLVLNNLIKGFRPDSLYGYRRFYARSETIFFTNWSLLGFRFAPFTAFEGGILRQQKPDHKVYLFYPGFSGGVRTRNENLVFGTMEFRVYYFPITVPGVSRIEFKFSTNLRIKYTGSFVNAPSLLNFN